MKLHAPHATHKGTIGNYRTLCSSSGSLRGSGLVADHLENVDYKRCLTMLANAAQAQPATESKTEAEIVAEVKAYRERLIALGRGHLVTK